jgi:bacterioferritin
VRGDPDVIEVLNEILTGELTAINQYFVHARMCRNWGYRRLDKRFYEESVDEMRDADKLIERILYLEGVPNLQRLNPVRVGEEPREQLELALTSEREAIARLNRGIALCRDRADNGTRELLAEILTGEEKSADWLEAQLHLVGEVGRERYLAEQIHE